MTRFTPVTTPHRARAQAAPEFASILIVDDQRFDRRRLRGLCAALPFTTQIVEASSLAALRSTLTKDRFDLILLDHHLTDGTGLEGVEHIRADRTNKDAAVVMITGTEQTDVAVQALKMGFSDYLTKEELNEQTLTRAAITALQKAQLGRSADSATAQASSDASIHSFSRACAKDIKPIVSRMMRQMRDLREIEALPPLKAKERVEQIEGSLHRLWAFLEDLEEIGASPQASAPGFAGTGDATAPITLRLPSGRPGSKTGPNAPKKTVKPPSVFRRRPD